MESEIDLLRQENARLMAKITGLEFERIELLKQVAEERTKHEAENAELRSRIEELEKDRSDVVAENGRRDDAIAELKAEVVKLRNDNEKIKQQTQDISLGEVVNIPSSVVDQLDNASEASSKIRLSCGSKQKTLEDKETNAFLNEVDKKRVSDEIRQRSREKKLQCELPSQEAHSISQNTASTTSTTFHERKNERDLIREMISSKEEKHVTEILANLVHPNNDRERNEDIISLYKNVCNAKVGAIEANREETLRWYFYAREFKSMYKDFMVSNKVREKKAKGQVYDFIIKQLPDTKRKTLCKQTQKALRIDNLFEKIGMDKIQYIKTYSADIISKFTNSQIQTIIDYFTKKSDIEYTDDQNNSSDDLSETEVRILPDTEVSASSSDTKKTLLEME
ncbi:1680_t:CDS:2, partial [Ambispora gerdemannii]